MTETEKIDPPVDESQPDLALAEEALGEPMPQEIKRAILAVWRLILPQIARITEKSHANGKEEVKKAVGAWMLQDIEEYKRKRITFVKKWQLRGLRKILFRIEALKQILREIERL